MSDAPSRVEMLMQAQLILQAADRDDRADGPERIRRADVVLAEAGFSQANIAHVLGRNREAVKSSLRRARKRTQRADDTPQ
jgi:RNA-binding protein YlmH